MERFWRGSQSDLAHSIASYDLRGMAREPQELGGYTYYAAFTRAISSDLPASDSLVRASQEPLQAQQCVLLRAAAKTFDMQEAQLLRATAQ